MTSRKSPAKFVFVQKEAQAVNANILLLGNIVQAQKARIVSGIHIFLSGVAEPYHDPRYGGGGRLLFFCDLLEQSKNIRHTVPHILTFYIQKRKRAPDSGGVRRDFFY